MLLRCAKALNEYCRTVYASNETPPEDGPPGGTFPENP
jgi:hypothetical protein